MEHSGRHGCLPTAIKDAIPDKKRSFACKALSEEDRNLLASCSDDCQVRTIPNYVNSQTREMPEMIATRVGLSSQMEFGKALKSQ